ncbi:MAG: lysophospholipid acyltransferase family protein [Verrucomicrobiota bacterium]
MSEEQPVIAFANHTNWWDGLIVFLLTRSLRSKDFYCMMEERQMMHYSFFAWLGAFSVDLDNRIRAAATIRYACNLLKNKRSMVWIFPQGEMVSEYDDVQVKPGVDFLAKRFKHAQMLPMALHYEFRREQRPFVFLRFGAPYSARDNTDERLESELQNLVDQIRSNCQSGDFSEYQPLLKPALSINKRWEWVKRLFTGKLSGFSRDN